MGPVEIIIIVAVSVAVLGAVGWLIYKKATGKGSTCGCGCEGCPHSKNCKH